MEKRGLETILITKDKNTGGYSIMSLENFEKQLGMLEMAKTLINFRIMKNIDKAVIKDKK